jgi:hypothetical protein
MVFINTIQHHRKLQNEVVNEQEVLSTVLNRKIQPMPMKIVADAVVNIPDFKTEASSEILFCEKSTGWSKKRFPTEIFTGHSLNRCSDPSFVASGYFLGVTRAYKRIRSNFG